MLKNTDYNPDVLSCIANLSSDEVFTPPEVVNQMLDMLPQSLFSSKDTTFLDPASKSGIFLREIAKRLIIGLEKEIPDLQERLNHIYSKQLFGIAITELTALLSRRSLYCSKQANGKYSVCEAFDEPEGMILYENNEHTWDKGRCIYCRANEKNYDRGEELENHAYTFIHTENPEEIFNMKFDVIIGNPPYQISDGGHGRSASPIYQKFVEQAMQLEPDYLVMIIPARWFIGGKGLDKFRLSMLSDKRIKYLADYENSADVFPGVDIAGGVCYFLWEKNYSGQCEVENLSKSSRYISKRDLNEYPVLIRHSRAISIVKKVHSFKENDNKRLSDTVSSRKPFGLPTNYMPRDKGVPCWFIQRIGLKYAHKEDVKDRNGYLDKWKLLIPKSPIAGQTDFSKPVGFYYDGNIRIAKPGECCTESWLVACAFDTRQEVLSFKTYLFTKIVRFLLLQAVISQDVTRQNFMFVPDLGTYSGEYNDDLLKKRWNITDEEWEFIDSKIKTIEYQTDVEDVIYE